MKIEQNNSISILMNKKGNQSNELLFQQIMNQSTGGMTEKSSSPFTASSVTEEINTMFIKEQEVGAYREGNPQALKEGYTAILEKAVEQDAFSDPKSFMKNLSESERDTLKQASFYGVKLSDSEIDSMSFEGAYNILLPRHMRLDMDGNGLTASGNGQAFVFPSSNAPDDVKAAWAEMTEGMSPKERLLASIPMMTTYMSANFQAQMNGASFDEYVDPFNAEGFSYMTWAEERYESNEYFKAQTGNEQYERTKSFLNKFMEVFSKHGVA